jgi:hypothetical protein
MKKYGAIVMIAFSACAFLPKNSWALTCDDVVAGQTSEMYGPSTCQIEMDDHPFTCTYTTNRGRSGTCTGGANTYNFCCRFSCACDCASNTSENYRGGTCGCTEVASGRPTPRYSDCSCSLTCGTNCKLNSSCACEVDCPADGTDGTGTYTYAASGSC